MMEDFIFLLGMFFALYFSTIVGVIFYHILDKENN